MNYLNSTLVSSLVPRLNELCQSILNQFSIFNYSYYQNEKIFFLFLLPFANVSILHNVSLLQKCKYLHLTVVYKKHVLNFDMISDISETFELIKLLVMMVTIMEAWKLKENHSDSGLLIPCGGFCNLARASGILERRSISLWPRALSYVNRCRALSCSNVQATDFPREYRNQFLGCVPARYGRWVTGWAGVGLLRRRSSSLGETTHLRERRFARLHESLGLTVSCS